MEDKHFIHNILYKLIFLFVKMRNLFFGKLMFLFLTCYHICLNKYIWITKIEYIVTYDVDRRHWHELANKELEESLSYHWNLKKAKNVILFVGDGMSPDTIAASRIYRGGEISRLAWEHFLHIGVLKVSWFLLDMYCN